jgi:hypothetical protein
MQDIWLVLGSRLFVHRTDHPGSVVLSTVQKYE